MHVFWKIRGFNRHNRGYFDRLLYLDTDLLDTVTRHKVEHYIETQRSFDRELIKYRALFSQCDDPTSVVPNGGETGRVVSVENYLEDESGAEITMTEVARLKTGNPNVIAYPPGYREHDIRLSMSPNSPLPENPIEHISLTQDEIDALAYFARDVKELRQNPFYNSPPVLHGSAGETRVSTIETDYIRSYVTVFRRLYMEREPGTTRKPVRPMSRIS